ncbi:APC family permease [Mycoplasma sp. 327]
MKNKFSEKSFFLYGINFIVGFGFITTITGIIAQGIWGMLVFALTSFISFSVILAFARGAQAFGNEAGGSYVYAKKASANKFWVFFNGWNQFSQIPLFSATTILFFSTLLSEFDKSHQLIYQIVSLVFFLSLTLIATFGIKTSKWFILFSASVKWITIILGVSLGIYLSFSSLDFANNILTNSKVSVSIITINVLNFIYAFGGAEGLAGISANVETKRFKKILLLIFAAVLAIYFTLYLLLLGLQKGFIGESTSFSKFFQSLWGLAGLIIFMIGTLFNRISSTLSANIYYSRIVAPLAHDGFLPSKLGKKNKHGEYRNALLFATGFSVISMIIFTAIPYALGIKDQFSFILNAGNVVFLMQYLLVIISILVIAFKHRTFRLTWWETTIFILSIILIIFILVVNFIPPIVGDEYTKGTIFLAPSYLGVMLIGFVIWGIYSAVKQRKKKNISKTYELKI